MASGKSPKSPSLGATGTFDRPRDPSRSAERDIGSALRAAYDSTVSEAIPPEMLDLLSKLR